MNWIVIALVAGFVVGLALVIVGLRGRRVGDEPRCRKCKYELTGLESDDCPECGRKISAMSTVYGHRTRRRALWMPGALLMLVCTSAAGYATYAWAKNLQYKDYPGFVLMWLIRQDDQRAFVELLNRFGTKQEVSPEQLRSVIPHAIKRYSEATDYKSAAFWPGLITVVHNEGVLDEKGRLEVHAAIARTRLESRPRIRVGDQLHVLLFYESIILPEPPYDVMRIESEVSLGDGEPTVLDAREADVRIGQHLGGMVIQKDIDVTAKPGKQPLVLRTKKTLFRVDGEARVPVFEKAEERYYYVDVLPADAPDTVQQFNDPSMAERFKAARTIVPVDGSEFGEGKFAVDVSKAGPVPMDGVFDLLLEGGDESFRIGIHVFQVSSKMPYLEERRWPVQASRLEPGVEYTPVLRPNPDFARQTTDIFKIWGGEVRYEPFTLESIQPLLGDSAEVKESADSQAAEAAN